MRWRHMAVPLALSILVGLVLKGGITDLAGLVSKKLPTAVRLTMRQAAFSLFASAVSGGSRKPSITPLKAGMEVKAVPILSDNYSYLLIDREKKVGAVVDPAEPRTMLEAAKQEGISLTTILTTHHHWDHAGGNDEMKKLVPGLRVYAPKDDKIPSATDNITEGDEVAIEGSDQKLQVLGTPCHTRGHVCYYSKDAGAVFTGDTLFVGGCGRFFEGNARQMLSALTKLGDLPGETQVFCGHEYSVANLRFAEAVEGKNDDVMSKLAWAKQQREQGLPTIPSTIAEELKYNPFMRTDSAEIRSHVAREDPVEVMNALRNAKNNF